VYTEMNWWTKIRLEVLREESTKREVLRREGIAWDTLKKILANPSPPGYQILVPSQRLAVSLSRLLRSFRAIKIIPRSSVIQPSGYMNA
jgi:hypothetical protein